MAKKAQQSPSPVVAATPEEVAAATGATGANVSAEPIAPKNIDDPRYAMAKKIWESMPKVRINVNPKKNQKDGKFDILAEINGIPWYGEKGKACIVPAEVARIAIQAGKATGELPEGFTDQLSPAGKIELLAIHPDEALVDPAKAPAGEVRLGG